MSDWLPVIQQLTQEYPHVVFLNNNGYSSNYHQKEHLVGASKHCHLGFFNCFSILENLYDKKVALMGYLSYDLKNELEKLTSKNLDNLQLPSMYFIQPEVMLERVASENWKTVHGSFEQKKPEIPSGLQKPMQLQQRLSKQEYLEAIWSIKENLRQGDVYEMNFCMEFYAENVIIDGLQLYKRLNDYSPAPFSCFVQSPDFYIISTSPERFIQKQGKQLISQPMKGTARRGNTVEEDEELKKELQSNEKERAENIMIVDLVRNDLSRNCSPGTVKVKELCEVISYPSVHQMISTIEGSLEKDKHPINALKAAFPMGSMTGAPKIKAMELIEEYEATKRGVFSGSVGYIEENGDFDFNVLIRTLVYSRKTKYLSLHVGSAITIDSDPEKEYEECCLKAHNIQEVLRNW